MWTSQALGAPCPLGHTSSSPWTGGTAPVYKARQGRTLGSQCPRGDSAGPLPERSASPGHKSGLSL